MGITDKWLMDDKKNWYKQNTTKGKWIGSVRSIHPFRPRSPLNQPDLPEHGNVHGSLSIHVLQGGMDL